MKTALAVLASLTVLGARPAARPAKLELQVITASPEGFLVNSTLISGRRDAVLIDAAFTRGDARRIVAAVRASGKNLTTVYVTHDHPDHYFGLEVIKQSFPSARFVALPGAVADIERTWQSKVAQWKPLYGDSITSTPVIPTALAGNSITLEGEKLEIVGPVQGDDAVNSFVWIPSLKTVVTGDIVYSGVYVWTAETDTAARRHWAATLDRIAALHPAVVVPGHQQHALGTTPASVAFTKEYLAAFDQALASASTPEDLQTKMKARYPSLALDIILKIGADAALPARGSGPQYPPPPPEQQMPAVERNLQTFDVLDFDVFSNQKWDRLQESHAPDIVVTWPDGHETKGIDVHIADLKALFVWGPDIQIKVHPIRFGSGSWTAVTGVMSGTFSRPMPTPDGGTIAPTGKRFAIAMATIGHWVNGRMDHEWLFWDNQDFYRQIGLGK
jgi:glyoxylase-like metal-dependent hydrolase (beta-lactamase superfamily II)